MLNPDAADIRRSPRKATSITHGPRRQICQKCTGPDRHYRVDCPDHSGSAKRAKRLQMAREIRQAQLNEAAQQTRPNTHSPSDDRPESMNLPSQSIPSPTANGDSLSSSLLAVPEQQPVSEIFSPRNAIVLQTRPQGRMDFIFPSSVSHTPLPSDTPAVRTFSIEHGQDLNTLSLPGNMTNVSQVITPGDTPIPGGLAFGSAPSSPSTSQAITIIANPATSPRRHRKRPPLTQPGEQRIRPSKSNPVYGLVDGSKRGSERWEVTRKVPQLKILPTWADCNKKFNEKMQAVIRLAEETADETGCWLYLAAQMPTGRHEYTHFANRRLRREAPGPVNDINAIVHKMFAGLVSSRRKDVLQLELEVANQRMDMQRLAEEKDALSQAKNEADAIIQGLRSRLAASSSVSLEELTHLLDNPDSSTLTKE
ncbi:hypothetical protein VNI00_015579 [Paramarasmius palmivorus]|uniref:CCHC-type domain-containing protein n=1 Tax=Paramarasmius palmivorus TaxID=297713 RepID=A0AAW0BL39_9AGAR